MCQLLRAGPGGGVTRLIVTFLGSQLDKPRLFLVANNRVHVNTAVIINAIVLYIPVFMYLLEIKLLHLLLWSQIKYLNQIEAPTPGNLRDSITLFPTLLYNVNMAIWLGLVFVQLCERLPWHIGVCVEVIIIKIQIYYILWANKIYRCHSRLWK